MLKMLLYVSKFPTFWGKCRKESTIKKTSLSKFHTLLRGGVVYMAGFPGPPLVRIGESVKVFI